MTEITRASRDTPIELRIHGLDCAEEVAILRAQIGPLVGGEDHLGFDVLRGKMTISPRAGRVDRETVRQAVARTGMRAEPWRRGPVPGRRRWWSARGLSVTLSGLLLLAAVLMHGALTGSVTAALTGGPEGAALPLAVRVLYALAIVGGAWFILPKAWHAARSARPDMHLLMTVAVAGAVGIGEWLEAATVSFLFGLSLVLESWSVGRARRAVEALLDLSPPTARVVDGGGEREVPAAEVEPGTVFVVRPGERLPLDGEVLEGASEVDQAPITGESAPVPKQPGSTVFAGTINGDGVLEVRSTLPADRTTLARIIRLVEEAQSRRSPSERWVDRFARVYTPAVLVLALAVLLVPPLLLGGAWGEWLYRALVLLVIACPCALVISTPVSVMAALAAAARGGVLVKGGAHLEAPARLRAVAFDKTGTLTRGRFEVVEVVPLNGHDESGLLARAAALEARSEHPLARAVVERAHRLGVGFEPAAGVRSLRGRGAVGRIGGAEYWVGSHRYLEERGQATPDVERRMAEMAGTGRTVVVVGNERHVCGLLAVADRLRPEAPAVVRELRGQGVEHLVMLTGDNRPTADAVAAELDIREVEADLLPEDKVAAVERLVERHGRVAMVGDGVNDAPAMARSDLSIAMGAAGSDAAIETADVALMADDLSRLPWLLAHSRRMLAIIRQNIALALGVKLAVFLLAVAGHATLWAAIAADMGASLAVIANGLRLLRGHPLGR